MMLMGNDDVSRSFHFPEEFTLTKKKKEKIHTVMNRSGSSCVSFTAHHATSLSLGVSIDLLNAD